MAEGPGLRIQVVRSALDRDGNSLHVTGRKGRVGTDAGWYVGLAAEQETGSPQLGHVVTNCEKVCLCALRGW